MASEDLKKKARMAALRIMSGYSVDSIESVGLLKGLKEKEKKQMKKMTRNK